MLALVGFFGRFTWWVLGFRVYDLGIMCWFMVGGVLPIIQSHRKTMEHHMETEIMWWLIRFQDT